MTQSPIDAEDPCAALRKEVYGLLDDADPVQQEALQALSHPRDASLASTLETLFGSTATGRAEALRMETDNLRRLSRSRETERVFRPYGVLELLTPVIVDGKTQFAICSGPLLVEAWSPATRDTLARLCGTSTASLPGDLDQASLYTPAQLDALAGLQETLAAWVAGSVTAPPAAASAPAPESAALDLLQPGFTEHLDVLFGLILKSLPSDRALQLSETDRIRGLAERGRRLGEQARRLRDQSEGPPRPLSAHAVLATWCSKLETQFPHLRIRTRFEAETELVQASPRELHHLVYTLLCGIVDGLPEGRALVGVSTRNHVRNGHTLLHVEIRDGGGLATFAGVGGDLDQRLAEEQQHLTDEGAEWTVLASKLNAEIRILREQDAVTRADVFLPLAGEDDGDLTHTGTHQIWIVEDDDREVDALLRMLQPLPVSCTRFTSAAELRDRFSTTTSAPDLVLLKYYLPDERGAAVRQWLYEQDSHLPVILISSLDATHPGIATVNRLPSTLYLQKPFDASALVDMIHLNLDDTLSG